MTTPTEQPDAQRQPAKTGLDPDADIKQFAHLFVHGFRAELLNNPERLHDLREKEYAEKLAAWTLERIQTARLDESRNNYSAVIRVIQGRADNPDFMWSEVTASIAKRIAQLKAGEKV